MKLLNSIDDRLDDCSWIAIGVFDGIHIGHKTLLEDCLEKAERFKSI